VKEEVPESFAPEVGPERVKELKALRALKGAASRLSSAFMRGLSAKEAEGLKG